MVSDDGGRAQENRYVEGCILGIKKSFLKLARTTARGIGGCGEIEVVEVLIIHGKAATKESWIKENLDKPEALHRGGKTTRHKTQNETSQALAEDTKERRTKQGSRTKEKRNQIRKKCRKKGEEEGSWSVSFLDFIYLITERLITRLPGPEDWPKKNQNQSIGTNSFIFVPKETNEKLYTLLILIKFCHK
jgi:hypothetical protein